MDEWTDRFKDSCTTLTFFSIVKVAVFFMPTGTLRKIMAFLKVHSD